MTSWQPRFWPDAQPLVERLGRSFFRQLPQRPGVYLMHGNDNAVLYVGKARNLRHRLGSYRVANPDRMPRRILRLLCRVERIIWEECPDEAAALRRESELLLALKPRFNRAGVWPATKRFVGWRSLTTGLELALAPAAEDGWRWLGPFGGQAKPLHRSLGRLLWCELQPVRGWIGMPVGWLRGHTPETLQIPVSEPSALEELFNHLEGCCGGAAARLIHGLREPVCVFDRQGWTEDRRVVAEILGVPDPASPASLRTAHLPVRDSYNSSLPIVFGGAS